MGAKYRADLEPFDNTVTARVVASFGRAMSQFFGRIENYLTRA